MTKPLQEKTDVIVNYVRQQTKNGSWVHIGNRDIPRIFGISQLYAPRLLEAIKAHPNIVYEVDHKFPTRFKPYMFKWVENAEEKIEAGLSPAQFYWLSDEEVDKLKSIEPNNDYEANARILRLCNLLVSEGAKDWWMPIDVDAMSDLIVASQSETKTVVDQLIEANILIKAEKHSLYRLVLDPSFLPAIQEEAKADEVRVKPKQERKKRKSGMENISAEISNKNTFAIDNEKNGTIISEKRNVLEHLGENAANVSPNLTGMLEIEGQATFELALKNARILEQVARDAAEKTKWQIAALEQLSKRENDYERSYNAFTKLGIEHNALLNEFEATKEKADRLETRVRTLESESKKLCDYNERVMAYTQARMDVMLGQISSLIDEYASRPTYEKDEVVAARLKKKVWESVWGTINEIVGYKPESKAVPDLK